MKAPVTYIDLFIASDTPIESGERAVKIGPHRIFFENDADCTRFAAVLVEHRDALRDRARLPEEEVAV